uniref:Uncharacterized protein n=1 Tax=Scophthalmus maximus TaxID=52904 RepID=A0A8D3CW21_SCOMX
MNVLWTKLSLTQSTEITNQMLMFENPPCLIIFYRSRLGLHRLPPSDGHDAFAAAVDRLLLPDAHPVVRRHACEIAVLPVESLAADDGWHTQKGVYAGITVIVFYHFAPPLHQFVTVESVITSVSDLFPKLFRGRGRHEIFVLVFCSAFFLLHLPMVTEGGIYIFQLIDYYGCTRACQDFMAVCQCFAMAWIFGADHFRDIIKHMTGQKPSVFFELCWRYAIPLLSLISFILYLALYKSLKINDGYTYPDWAYALGWTMTLSSVVMVPLWAAGQMCVTPGTFRQRLSILCRPAEAPACPTEDGKPGEEGLTVGLTMSVMTD